MFLKTYVDYTSVDNNSWKNNYFKTNKINEQLVETFRGGRRLVAVVLKLWTYLFPMSLHMLAGLPTHIADFRPRCARFHEPVAWDGNLMLASHAWSYQLFTERRCIPLSLKVVASSYVVGLYHSWVGWWRLVSPCSLWFRITVGRVGARIKFSKNSWFKSSVEVHV